MPEKHVPVIFWDFRHDWYLRLSDFFQIVPPVIPCLIHGRELEFTWPNAELVINPAATAVGACVSFPESELPRFLDRWKLELEESRLVEGRLPGDAVISFDGRIVKLTPQTSIFDSEKDADRVFLRNLGFFGHYSSFQNQWKQLLASALSSQTLNTAKGLLKTLRLSTPTPETETTGPSGFPALHWNRLSAGSLENEISGSFEFPGANGNQISNEPQGDSIRLYLFEEQGSFGTTIPNRPLFLNFIELLECAPVGRFQTLVLAPSDTSLAIPIEMDSEGWRIVRHRQIQIPTRRESGETTVH